MTQPPKAEVQRDGDLLARIVARDDAALGGLTQAEIAAQTGSLAPTTDPIMTSDVTS